LRLCSCHALPVCRASDFFFFSSRRRHTRLVSDWSSDVCSSDLEKFLWRKWDVVLAISPDEASVIGPSLRPTQRLLTIGHAVQARSEERRVGKECRAGGAADR